MDTARRWARNVLNEHDVGAAWALCDEDYRVATVQEWLLHKVGEAPELVAEMASTSPSSTLWPEFADALLHTWITGITENIGIGRWEIFGQMLPEEDRREWIEPLAPDIELVRLTPSGSTRRLLLQALMQDGGDTVVSVSLLLRRRDGRWALGGMRRCLAVPGWPPTKLRFESEHEVGQTDDDR